MSWYTDAPGDTVNLTANLRLDLVDALALGQLPLDAVAECMGALMGDTEGVFEAPVLVYGTDGTAHWVDVGPFQYWWSHSARRADGAQLRDPGPRTTDGGSYFGDGQVKARRGLVVTHDPSDDSQTSRVDITAYAAVAREALVDGVVTRVEKNFPYLWARPYFLATDTDARRKWDEGTEAEVSVSVPTRLRVRTEFAFALERPLVPVDGAGVPTEAPWVCLGRVTDWVTPGTQAAPVLSPLSALDAWEIQHFLSEAGTANYTGTDEAAGAGEGQTGQSPLVGLAPSPGPTASISPLFGPTPAITADDLYRVDGEVIGNKGQQSPQGMGLVQGLHLVRDRLRHHLSGQQAGDRRYPWYEIPKYGLIALSRMADLATARMDLIEVLISQATATARAELAAAVANLSGGVPVLGWADVDHNSQDGTVTLRAGYKVKESGGVVRGSLDTRVYFEIPESEVGTICVYPRLSLVEGNYGETGLGTYDPVKGGYTAKDKGQAYWANPDSPQYRFIASVVKTEGPDHSAGDGTYVNVKGSFGVIVYGKAQ